METRLLKYFLAVAQEGSISKASNVLHITQPTLSRQIKSFEESLGTILFDRNNNMALTSTGLLLRERAIEILQLVNKVEGEIEIQGKENLTGHISFGCIEGTGSAIFSELVASFHEKYPQVTYSIYTGVGDDITDRIDKGIIDVGVVLEPIALNKYKFVPFNNPEPWGILVHRNHPSADLDIVTPDDLVDQALFIADREPIIQRLSKWFNKDINELNIIGNYKLLSNVALLVEKEVGIAITIQGPALHYQNEDTKFISLESATKSDSLLVWKKDRILSQMVEKFIEHSKEMLKEKLN